jgi:hypothetical protein
VVVAVAGENADNGVLGGAAGVAIVAGGTVDGVAVDAGVVDVAAVGAGGLVGVVAPFGDVHAGFLLALAAVAVVALPLLAVVAAAVVAAAVATMTIVAVAKATGDGGWEGDQETGRAARQRLARTHRETGAGTVDA